MTTSFCATDQRYAGGRGFQMNFLNGYSLSVQWGKHNYCDNRQLGSDSLPAIIPMSCQNAELMIAYGDEGIGYDRFPEPLTKWKSHFDTFGIASFMSPDDVAMLLSDIASMPGSAVPLPYVDQEMSE